MIGFIKGEIIDMSPTSAMIFSGGLGYEISIPLNTLSDLDIHDTAELYLHLKVSESDMQLFGFETKEAKVLFKRIIEVSGIGPVTGLLLMSSLSRDEILSAVLAEDTSVFEKIKGIGAKTAKQIILDMRRYAEKNYTAPGDGEGAKEVLYTFLDQALQALISLGIAKASANKAITDVINSHVAIQDVGDLIKKALKYVK